MRAFVDTSALDSFMIAARDVSAGVRDPLTAWVGYERRHRDLFARYFDGWGGAEHRSAAAAVMVQTAETVTAAKVDWHGRLEDVAARMTPLVRRGVSD